MQNNSNQKPKIIFLLGGPGSGKGTQSDIMVKKYHFIHFSTGDLLRDFIKSDCEEAAKIRDFLKEGKLAPSTMLVEIIKKKIFQNGSNNYTYLIDGFPRSIQNHDAWKQVMKDEVDVKTLININCSQQTLQKRLLERGKTSQRQDDNRQTIIKRFKTFKDQTQPFVKYYLQTVGGVVHTINGQNSIQEVTQVIKNILLNQNLI